MRGPSNVHALVSISRLAEMTGVTPRALRYYEDAGLIRPSRTPTGARQFTPEQCARVATIVRLRRCDVPLGVIREVLADTGCRADRRAHLQRVLRDKARELTRKLKVVTAAMAEAG